MDVVLGDVRLLESWYLTCCEEFMYAYGSVCLCLYVCERQAAKTILKNMVDTFLNFSLFS